ncbi:MAG TPA: TIGR01777 family oxidoreductase [Anaerolineaceae bacterium]|nr:TIGR01777 family oxidoreductase [Anaerolineaceae bacterium]HPN52485.1 TIGR01777 family oxidoreductase [Anaerolineaceae bacterium]
MHILMTGGTGLIGQALTSLLLEAGHRVTLLTRRPEAARAPAGARLAAWDGRSANGWAHLLGEGDAVINLAGQSIAASRWTPAQKQLILQSRLDAGRAVMDALKQAPGRPAVLLQASAVGYYGPCGDEELDENAPAGSDFLAEVCRQWEESTFEAEELGLRRVVLRTGVVLAAQGGALERLAMPFRLFGGGPVGSGRQWLPWIHLRDQANAMRFLLENPAAAGVFNLAAPQLQRNAEFGKTLARVLQRPYWLPAPAFALRLALGELSTIALDGQRAVPHRLLQMGYRFDFPELQPALENLFKKGA